MDGGGVLSKAAEAVRQASRPTAANHSFAGLAEAGRPTTHPPSLSTDLLPFHPINALGLKSP